MSNFIYPIDTDQFQKIREQGKLYVDKTDLIFDIVNVKKYQYVFLARPRRFGKSLLCNTFKAYFQGQKELFEGLKIMNLENDWHPYPVLHFDMSEMRNCTTIQDMREVLSAMLDRYESFYGTHRRINEFGSRFGQLIHHIYSTTGKKVVILFDEYDSPLMRNLYNPDLLDDVRTLLRSFYQRVKIDDAYLHFVFITGVTKFSQLSVFSELNNLKQISMIDEYSRICGITQIELDTILRPCVEEFASGLKITVDEAYSILKKNYDGYHFSPNGEDVYAPFSLLNAFDENTAKHYWFESGTMTALIEHLKHYTITDAIEYDGVKVGENEFNVSCETADTPMPLLYQSGYLTIDSYNAKQNSYILHFPNLEVRNGMILGLMPLILKRTTADSNTLMFKMTDALVAGNISSAISALRSYVANIPYDIITKKEWDKKEKRESFFKLLLYMVFSMLNSVVETEVKSILGRADVVIKTENDIFVLELKVDDTVDNALKQIDQKGYSIPYESDGRKLTMCGISISSKKRNIVHWRAINANGEVIDEQQY